MPPATTSAQAMGNLQQFTGGMQSPEQVLQKQEQGLGVQAAQGAVTGLRGAIANTTRLLDNVAPSVMGRTANSLVTSAQADRQIANEQAPINTQLNKETQDYQAANQDYTNAEQRAETLANADMQAQSEKAGYLQNIYNSLYQQEQNSAAAAEQKRMDNAQIAASQASMRAASSGPSPSFGGGGGGGNSSPYSMATDKGGGFQFSMGGKPITAAQYIAGQGGTYADLVKLLSTSKNPGDSKIIRDMQSGMGRAQLMQKYPYVFGGV